MPPFHLGSRQQGRVELLYPPDTWRAHFALVVLALAVAPPAIAALLTHLTPWASPSRLLALAAALNATLNVAVLCCLYRHRCQLEGAQAELVRLASTDPLTGLGNRRRLWEAMGLVDRMGAPRCLLFIFDLNNFKAINDERGHAEGDRVLIAFAAALRGATRAGTDALFRTGGDEFAALLPDIDGEDGGGVAARVLELFRAELDLRSPGTRCTAAVGIAARQPDEPLEAWLGRADAAMYRAKAERAALRFAELRGAERRWGAGLEG